METQEALALKAGEGPAETVPAVFWRGVTAHGDNVILHVHSVREKDTRGRAIVDIFRLENGKIVEHWDVVQEIPEKAANTNGMF